MFKKIAATTFTAFAFFGSVSVWAAPTVVIETNLGHVTIELDSEKAPITTKNFMEYVNSGFYDGTIFHRVIPGFMAQGGGFDESMKQKMTLPPIKNEAQNGLKNDRGTVAMARTNSIDSATSQFFINVVDNDFLNYSSPSNFGYAVFGKVTSGMDVVDKMIAEPTHRVGPHGNVPQKTIKILSVKVESGN